MNDYTLLFITVECSMLDTFYAILLFAHGYRITRPKEALESPEVHLTNALVNSIVV